ncbi:unnamed protein product [Arabidopsis halleri]
MRKFQRPYHPMVGSFVNAGYHLMEIIESTTTTHPPSPAAGQDFPLWMFKEDDFRPRFSAKYTWEQVPKYYFITCVALKDRLAT